MNRYFAHVIAETGDPDAAVGALLEIERFERFGGMPDSVLVAVHVLVGDRSVSLRAGAVEVLDAAAAKRLRLNRKRDADRASAAWRGPAR